MKFLIGAKNLGVILFFFLFSNSISAQIDRRAENEQFKASGNSLMASAKARRNPKFFLADVPGAGHSPKNRASVKNANWQTSVPEIIDREKTSLGVRDKWGSLGTYNVLFVARSSDKKVFRAKTRGKGDDWAMVDFPFKFQGKPMTGDTLTVLFYVNGVFIGRDEFTYNP